MTLERKDVRAKLDPEDHARLTAVAAHDDRDIGAWVEQLILRELASREAAARREASLVDKLDRLGISGKTRDSSGNP